MKKTGALLKAKREDSGLSLSEVALATKINPKILTAIENGDEAGLPAKTFLKGFVRSYAAFLKMDLDEVMKSFQEEMGRPAPVAERAIENEPAATSRRGVDEESSSGLRTIAVVVIVFLIGMIIGVRELIEKYQREKVVEKVELQASPIAETTPPVVVEPENAAEEPAAETEAEQTETGTATETTTPTPTITTTSPATAAPSEVKEEPKEEVAAPAKETPPPAKPMPTPTSRVVEAGRMVVPNLVELRPGMRTASEKPVEPAKVEAKPEVKAEAKPATTSQAVGSAIAHAKHEIIVEALDKVEVKFKVKGEVRKVSLGPTQVHTIRADEPMTLDFSDGGAVNIILNGRERGVPGDLGKPKSIRIP